MLFQGQEFVESRSFSDTVPLDWNQCERHQLAELGYDGYVAMEFLATGDPVTTIARAREEALVAANG